MTGRTKNKVTVADLTMQDGRVTGHVTMSRTEGGQTVTTERRIDTGPAVRLTEGQFRVLVVLCGQDVQRDGGLSTPEISHRLGRRLDDWARIKLTELEKRELAVRLWKSSMLGQFWRATEAGRAALASTRSRDDE